MLDFLLAFLPVDTRYLSPREKVTLVAAALEVLLRRDMSLNRRLYTWLLGTNSTKNESLSRTDSVCSSDADHEGPTESFFSLHSRLLVIEAVRKVFHSQSRFEKGDANGSKKAQRLEVLKPFRLLISLLDKPEIGGSILEDVLLDVFRSLYNQCKLLKENGAAFEESDRRDSIESTHQESAFTDSAKTKLIDELIKTANLLFNAFEPYFMWEYIAKLLSDCDQPSLADGVNGVNRDRCDSNAFYSKLATNCAEVFRLTDFILDVVTLVSCLCICLFIKRTEYSSVVKWKEVQLGTKKISESRWQSNPCPLIHCSGERLSALFILVQDAFGRFADPTISYKIDETLVLKSHSSMLSKYWPKSHSKAIYL